MFKRREKTTYAILAILALAAICLPLSSFWSAQASGTLSGRVFQDFNGNGAYDTTLTIMNNGVGTTGVAVDRGVQSVTVTAYDSAGAAQGSASTAADGTYSIAATGTGPYRVEFTNLPAGFYPSARNTDSVLGGTNTNSGSSVQFVNDGSTSNINLAVNYPEDYSQDNPEIVSSLYQAGDQGGAVSGQPTLISFPYGAGSTDTASGANQAAFDAPTVWPLNLSAGEVGTTQGLAYARRSRTIFAGAFFKRHAGFGPTGPNAVYRITRASGGSVLNSYVVPGTATNAHDTANYPRDNGNTGWDAVGKTSLGGMAISEDESRLYVINLANRTLYALNPATGASLASQATPTNLPLPSGTCPANDARPFAVTWYHGSLYVGLVCSAESSATVDTFTDGNANGVHDGAEYHIETNGTAGRQAGEPFLDFDGDTNYDAGEAFVDNDGNGFYNLGDARNLRAYVYQVNPTTLAFGGSPLFQMPLNYRRGIATHSAGAFAVWRPWSTVYRSAMAGLRVVYSQPMLTDIAFDNGNLILGLRDRSGDQVGNGSLSNPGDASNTNFYQPRTSGDVIRACGSFGSWTVESNGRCGGIGSAPQNTSEGPGGGEFYYGDAYDLQDAYTSPAMTIDGKGGNHDDTANGGVEQMPGAPDVVITNFDPIPNVPNMIHDGGIRWLSNTTGNFRKGYRLYDGDSNDNGSMGKAGGVGGAILLMPDPAPLEIGNRVWSDTDGDGVQDPGENGISGVTVRLYNSGNTLAGTAVTDANGEYYFVGSTSADGNTGDSIGQVNGGIAYSSSYQVRFDLAANYGAGGPLNNRLLTTLNQTTQAGFDDGSDSDSSLVTSPTGSPAGTYPVIAVTTGGPGENNHTFDTGFATSATYSLGNRVWFDTNNDGQINAGEVGLSGVSVSLYVDANADGIPDNVGSPTGTMSTDASGYYRFDSLAAGNYVVRVNPSNFANGAVLGGYRNTTGSNAADLDSTSVAGQNGENGVDPAGAANFVQTNGVLSATVVIGAPGEPTNEADVQGSGQGSIDPAANMTVDFGFYRMCYTGTVWADNGAGGFNNNGMINAGEAGVPFVRVRLYDSANAEILVGPDGVLGTSDDAVNGVWTNGSGNYSFCGLSSATYRMVVTPAGGTSSTPTSTTPDNNIDSDDNGFPDNTGNFPSRVIGGLVTTAPGSLGALSNNTVTNATGTTTNPTVDFGFVAPPTSVSLKSFTAHTDGNSVTLKWATGGEADNLGFNVYRQKADGTRELVNSSLIGGSALRTRTNLAATADDYRWKDQSGNPSAVYYLEDIDLAGNTTLHGPVSPMLSFSAEDLSPNSKLLSELSAVDRVSAQKDTVGTAAPANVSGNANEPGVKISVDHDGWYRVSAAQLAASGFDLNSNRDLWKLSLGGVEVPIRVNNDNSIDFFGRGLDTPYTATRAYYLAVGNSAGLRVADVRGGRAGDQAIPAGFQNIAQRKDRTIYVSAILNGDAENWFGAVVSPTMQTTQDLTAYNPNELGTGARLSVKLQGLSMSQHSVSIKFNDVELGPVEFAAQNNQQFDFDLPMSAVLDGVNQVKLQSQGGGDVSLVDSITLSYSRKYAAQNDRLRFTVPARQPVRVNGFTTRDIRLLEISNGIGAISPAPFVERNGNSYSFSLSASTHDREFVVTTEGGFEQAAAVQRYTPADWSSPSNSADLVIITPQNLRDHAQTLAQRRTAQGLQTALVTVEEIYDEFSSGVYSPDAVKQFVQAAAQWQVSPRYILFFGDSSFDMRNYLGQASRDMVPTKLIDTMDMETSSDSWFADLDDDGVENISIGRLPVANGAEALAMLDKLARYDAQAARATGSDAIISDHSFELFSDMLQAEVPQNVQVTRIDRAAMDDAQMRQSVLSELNGGPMVVTYTGHGSTGVWTNGGIFTSTDAVGLNNSQLSFYMLMTCLNGFSHNAYNDSLAERLLRSPNGAVAVWASSGSTFADEQLPMSLEATRLLLGEPAGQMRLGDIVRSAKNHAASNDVKRTWQLLGDPTVFIK